MKPLPKLPKRGLVLHFTCIRCDEEGLSPINSVRKKNDNPDGSTCYTIGFACPECGYKNGANRPIWYNFYKRGEILGGGVDLEKSGYCYKEYDPLFSLDC